MSFTTVQLKPTAGFVIKSTITQQSFYAKPSPPASGTLLEPASNGFAIPVGLKVFVNIAWDAGVPPPPEGSEDVIQRAMLGEDPDEYDAAEGGGWYVPVVVSDGREDKDKAGKASLVFDAVFHSSVKARTARDEAFKAFIIELAFQRIEAQTKGAVLLSRQIGTPNIASKGKLEARKVQIPSVLFAETPLPAAPAKGKKKLIEEVGPAEVKKTKGILKPSTARKAEQVKGKTTVPSWKWSKTSTKIKIVVDVPLLTHAHIPSATLDLEPRRIILSIPPLYALDVPLDAPDAELVATGADGGKWEEGALGLKRARDLDMDAAKAEWRVGEGCLVIYA